MNLRDRILGVPPVVLVLAIIATSAVTIGALSVAYAALQLAAAVSTPTR
jgi:hypothetical protein